MSLVTEILTKQSKCKQLDLWIDILVHTVTLIMGSMSCAPEQKIKPRWQKSEPHGMEVFHLLESWFCKRLPSHWSKVGLHKDHLVVWLVVRSVGCNYAKKWPNTQKDGCWLSYSDHIHGWYPFPDQTRNEEWLVESVFCKINTGSCISYSCVKNKVLGTLKNTIARLFVS